MDKFYVTFWSDLCITTSVGFLPESSSCRFVWSWFHLATTVWFPTPSPGTTMAKSSLTNQVRPSCATLTWRSVWPRTLSPCTPERKSNRFGWSCLFWTSIRLSLLTRRDRWVLVLVLPAGRDAAADRVPGHGAASAGSAGLRWPGRCEEGGRRRVAVWRTRLVQFPIKASLEGRHWFPGNHNKV